MQCSMSIRASGNKMKTNGYRNPYKKDSTLDNNVDQLCTKLQDIKDKEDSTQVGMPTISLEHSEAVRRYYAAFPALKKGQESPLQYYQPPYWCRKPETEVKMQSELPSSRDRNNKNKKFCKTSSKERRNSYHGQKKNRKRCNSYSRSLESKESLPEWVTHEGVWDMETQDPVKEFIRAIALDEGYGTCENTVTDDIKELAFRRADLVPDWDDTLDLDPDWIVEEDLQPKVRTPMEEELYAKFEAKFDRSIEALWAKDSTPDDEYQELPIDFQELLSSPSDQLFAAAECSLPLAGGVWAAPARSSAARLADSLHARLQPLQLADAPASAPALAPTAAPPAPLVPPAPELESLLYDGDEIYDALSTVACTLRSLTALNHSRDSSGFVEVPPRRGPAPPRPPARAERQREPSRDREDLLTSARTHFRPIRKEPEACYNDGDTFDIRGSLDPVDMRRSDSGGLYVGRERYLEYRASHTVDYTRLRLTAAQQCPDLDDPAFRLRFPLRQLDTGVQTEPEWGCDECGRTPKKMRAGADGVWASGGCTCAAPGEGGPPAAAPEAAEWEELLADISAAHAEYLRADVEDTLLSAERKRRHSAALQPPAAAPAPAPAAACSHPHTRFLHCCALALDRPLTR